MPQAYKQIALTRRFTQRKYTYIHRSNALFLEQIFQKIFFEIFDFSPFLGHFSPKKGSQPPNEIGNMPLRSDKIIKFGVGCYFQHQKC